MCCIKNCKYVHIKWSLINWTSTCSGWRLYLAAGNRLLLEAGDYRLSNKRKPRPFCWNIRPYIRRHVDHHNVPVTASYWQNGPIKNTSVARTSSARPVRCGQTWSLKPDQADKSWSELKGRSRGLCKACDSVVAFDTRLVRGAGADLHDLIRIRLGLQGKSE